MRMWVIIIVVFAIAWMVRGAAVDKQGILWKKA